MPDCKTVLESWTQVAFYLTPGTIFLLTAVVAIWRFNIFRTGKPAIQIDLEVSSRSTGGSWTVISAMASVTNSSKVLARCDSLQWEVRVLSPYSDDEVERKSEEYTPYMTTTGSTVEFPWNVQYLIKNDNPGIALEPGESNLVDMSIPIPTWIRAIDVRCTLVLPKSRDGAANIWTNRRPHDIHTHDIHTEEENAE